MMNKRRPGQLLIFSILLLLSAYTQPVAGQKNEPHRRRVYPGKQGNNKEMNSAKGVIDLSALLHEMIDYDVIAKWPEPSYSEKQASSYDRKSIAPGIPGWFARDDALQYIRTENNAGRLEHVMMDADGPGTIVRFWLTTFKRNGTLRIYFDNESDASVVIPAYDLMKTGLVIGASLLQPHSSYEAKEKGGSTLYLPMPFAQHCVGGPLLFF